MGHDRSDPGKSPFDVLIIGAGINGCATARELTRQGYCALVADRADLGGVTTARSGRVLHCGLQLLAPKRSIVDYLLDPLELTMRFRSARRAVRDFEEFCLELPGQLQPMTTFVPIFSESPYRGWQVDLGARLITAFGGKRSNIQYRRRPLADCRSDPFVSDLADRDALQSMVSFQDFRFCWPERIAIDAALAAERNGATLLPFTEVVELRRTSNGLWQAGLRGREGQQARASARMVLNLAGVWVDDVTARADPKSAVSRKVVAIKGIYVLVRLAERYRGLGLAGTNSRGEPICCLPWDDLHYVGPTETAFDGALDDVRPGEEDIAFLIAEINKFAPGLSITRGGVVMAWAGLRPITADDRFPKGKRLPFNVVHDLEEEGLPNMLSLSWGIVANHRSTAHALATAVSLKIRPSGQSSTGKPERGPLPGTGRRLQNDHPATDDDVRFCVEVEHANDLNGVLSSRTGLTWTGRLTADAVDAAAGTMAPLLSWSRARTLDECDRFKKRLKDDHCFDLV